MAGTDGGPENRKHARFSVRAPIYVALGGEVVRKTVHVEARDVSRGGLSFETGRDLPLGADAQIVLAHAGDEDAALAIRGRIVWTRLVPEAGRYLVGIEFTDFDGLSAEELASRIDELSS
jgi:c-di-GMP-binding flagellar brake protein YcgR